MNNHTPGKWEAIHRKQTDELPEQAYVHTASENLKIATCHHNNFRSIEEALANAHMMAAAPSMFEVLELEQQYLSKGNFQYGGLTYSSKENNWSAVKKIQELKEAALKAAKGGKYEK